MRKPTIIDVAELERVTGGVLPGGCIVREPRHPQDFPPQPPDLVDLSQLGKTRTERPLS